MPGASPHPELWEHVSSLPLIDTHEHIPGEETAREAGAQLGLFSFFEHYASSDLVSAGMSREALEKMRDPGNGLAPEERWALMAPFWPMVRHTGYGAAMREYMAELFGVEELDGSNWAELDRRIRAARQKPGWYREVMHDRANIETALVIRWPGQPVTVDRELFRAVPILDHYATPSTRADLEALERESGRSIQTLAQLMAAQEAMLDRFTVEGIAAVKIFLAYRRTLQFDVYTRGEASRAFDRIWLSQSMDLTFSDLKPLQDFMTRRVVVLAAERGLPVQIHTGLQEGNGNWLENSRPLLLTSLIMDYPDARFDLFHAGYPFTGELTALAKYFPNVCADLCWIPAISPGAAERILDEWIDLIPANKIFAVGGDSNYVEGAFGHCLRARRTVCAVLGGRVAAGTLSLKDAKWLAGRLLGENARDFFRL